MPLAHVSVILAVEVISLSTKEFERRLLNPAPGSAIAAARDFGIDLTLLIERLRLTPEERVRALQQVSFALTQIRGAARKHKQADNDRSANFSTLPG